MPSSESSINIQFTQKALNFIKTRRLSHPLVLVNVGFRSGSEDSGGGCSGGGGCGESESCNAPYANVVIVDGESPGSGFVRVDTPAGIPVYLAKPAFDAAKRSENPIFVTVKGLVIKRLILEGLDLSSIGDHSSKNGRGSD